MQRLKSVNFFLWVYKLFIMKTKNKVQITARLGGEIVEEIEQIAECLFANKTAIIEEMLRLGREAFKKERPDIMKLVEARLKHDSGKKGEHKRAV